MSFQDGTIDLSREIAGAQPSSTGAPVPPEEDFPKIIAQSLRWPTPTDAAYTGPAVRVTFVYQSPIEITIRHPDRVKLSNVLVEMDKALRAEDPTISRLGFRIRERRVVFSLFPPSFSWEYRYEILYADPTGGFPPLSLIVAALILILSILLVVWALVAGPETVTEFIEGVVTPLALGAGAILILGLVLVAGVRRRRS